MDLSNRTVLVTGGTSGIGLGIAEAFYKEKSKVIVCGRSANKRAAVKERAIRENPEDVGLYVKRGIAYDARRRRDEAIADFTKALDLDQASIDAYFQRGWSYLCVGEYDKGIADFTAVLNLEPGDADALRSRRSARLYKRKHEKAKAEWATAQGPGT